MKTFNLDTPQVCGLDLLSNNNKKNDVGGCCYDGDASTTSTFTVDRLPPKPVLKRCPSSLPSSSSSSLITETKSVCFDLESNVHHDPVHDKDFRAAWYSAGDYTEFKEQFVLTARRFQGHDKANPHPYGCKELLVKAFMKCYKAEQTANDDEKAESEDDFIAAARLDDVKEERALQKHLRSGSRRGLVRMTVLQIFADKAGRRRRLYEAVAAAQQQQASSPSDEELARTAAALSWPSRLFAWRLAQC